MSEQQGSNNYTLTRSEVHTCTVVPETARREHFSTNMEEEGRYPGRYPAIGRT